MARIQLMTIAAAGLLISAAGLANAEDAAARQNDQQITQQVKEKLAVDDPAVAPRIMVSTHDGVVTLRGIELNLADIATAMHDANDIAGVVRVENHLKMG